MADLSLSQRSETGPPGRQAARTLMAAEELNDELDRWSAYAQAAQDDAFRRASRAAAAVSVAVREAMFLADLCQRNEVSFADVHTLLDEAEATVKRTEEQLRARQESWMHSQHIADHAVLAWTATLDHASTDLAAAQARLLQECRKRDRLSVRAGSGSGSADSREAAGRREASERAVVRKLARSRRERDHPRQRPNVRQLAADAEAAVARAQDAVQTAQDRVTRHDRALATATRAEELVARSLRDLAEGLQSAGLAVDFVASARAIAERASRLVEQRVVVAEDMMLESKRAVRAVEASGRVLGALSSAYDEAQQHVFDARLEIEDRVGAFRNELAQARWGSK